MARMRSVKPEYWEDEELAMATSRDARMLYIAMWNIADEHARLRGDPRYIKGKAFAYDDDLTPDAIAKLIDELARAGRIVRYRTGGGRYLFLPKLAKHQRLEPDKTPSRLPGPEDADSEPDPPPENSPDPSEHFPELGSQIPNSGHVESSSQASHHSEKIPDESALARARSFKHVAGSREHVAGIPPTAGALALVPSEPPPNPQTAQDLIGEWIDHCRKRPPGTVIGQTGKQIKTMLAEGIDPADIRAGLAEWWRKGLHPSALPAAVNEHMNATPARASPRPSGDIDWQAAMQRAQAREAAQ